MWFIPKRWLILARFTEHILNQDPRVQTAIMFGRGRFNVGVIIEPKAEHAFDPADESKLIEFRKAILCAPSLSLYKYPH